MKYSKKLSRLLLTLLIASHAGVAVANGYGIYDTRTLALGGSGVALGDLRAGHFYNPALTAFHDGHEDRTRDGAHSLQIVLASLSDGARAAADALADNLEDELSNAIDNLNDVPTPETARNGIAAARDLEEAMRDLRGKSVDAEAYAGYSISQPADREGGAFFIGSRVVGQGLSRIEDADLDLLQDYIEALEFIESGGTRGADHPELRDGEGRFIDPSAQIQSSAAGTALLVSELGVSAAKEYLLWGQPVAVGLAPKVVHLRAFEETWRVVDGEFDSSGANITEYYFNMDLGAAATIAEVFRVGVAVKDLRKKTIFTELGEKLVLKPRSRLGVAYLGESFSVGVDADLNKTADLQNVRERRDVSLGIEYRLLKSLYLRTGYRHDLEGSVDDQIGTGVGWQLGRLILDFTYSGGSSTGAGFNLAWAI